VQFELARRGWIVDPIGVTANGIDLLAWKDGGPNMGISVKTRMRNERGSVTLFKNEPHAQAMRGECRLRGVTPYIAVVVFADRGNRGYLMRLDTFMDHYRRQPRPTTKTIEFSTERTGARWHFGPAVSQANPPPMPTTMTNTCS